MTTGSERLSYWTYFIGQNIYLFAAANGLNSVFKATFNRKSVTEKLKLEDHRKVLYVHTVGFPK